MICKEKVLHILSVFFQPFDSRPREGATMFKTIRLAILAAIVFSLSGCIAWRSGPYDYEFRVPVGDGTYKCCRTEKVKVAGVSPVSSPKIKGVGLPMSKVKFGSGKELSESLGNKEKLNATPEEFVEAINKYHKVGLNKETLPVYIENLEVVDCPEKDRYILSSVVVDGSKRHLGQVEREFKFGERCFKDRNTQTIIGSADCGNIGKPASSKDFALAEYKEIKVCETCEGPPRYYFGGTVSWGYPGGYYGGGYSSSGSAPVIGGGAPAVTAPPSPGPTPAAPSKVGGAPAPAYKSR